MLKIEPRNPILTKIKGHNSALFGRNLPIFDSKQLLPNMKSYKIGQKMLKIEPGNEILTLIKGKISLLI